MDFATERRLAQVLELRTAGLRPREIALELSISESTVFRMLRRVAK